MIVWDLGDVVAHFRPERRLAALARHTGLAPDHVDAVVWRSGLDRAAERGELSDDDVWRRTIDALDGRIERDTLRACWATAFEPNRAVLDLIDELQAPAALLTDNGPILEACLGEELDDIGSRFDHLLVSCRLGATKGSAMEDGGAVFRRAAAAIDVRPSDLTLVDDRDDNAAAARRVGWNAIVYTSVPDLTNRLPLPPGPDGERRSADR